MKFFTNCKPLFVFILCAFTQNTFAQKLYVSLKSGYNFAASTTTNIIYDYDPNSRLTWDKYEVSLGKGINIDGVFGYKFNKNISAELGISYLFGQTTTWNFTYYYNHYTKDFSATMLRFIPTIVFSTDFKTLNPYAKVGAIIGTGSFLISQLSTGDSANSNTTFQKTKYDGGLAIGVYCGLGATYKINKHVSILAEITNINMSYAAEKSELIESKLNGVDQLPGMSISQKQTEYVDSYYTTITFDPNKPSKGLKQNISYSSIGFNIGVTYHF